MYKISGDTSMIEAMHFIVELCDITLRECSDKRIEDIVKRHPGVRLIKEERELK